MSSQTSDLNRFDAHPQRHGWHVAAEAAGIVAATILLDNAKGILERHQESRAEADVPTEPIIHRAKFPTNRVVILGSGCDQDQVHHAKRGFKLFGGIAHVIMPVYGKYEINPDSIASQIIDASQELGVDEAVFVGSSMGAGILARAATNRVLRAQYPEAKGFVGLAPVLRSTNVALSCRGVLKAARFTRHSATIDRLYQAVYDLSGEAHDIAGLSFTIPKIPKMHPYEISRYDTALEGPLPKGCLYGFVNPANLIMIGNRAGKEYEDGVANLASACEDVMDVFGTVPQIIRNPSSAPHSHNASLQLPNRAQPVTLVQQAVEACFFPDNELFTERQVA